MNGPLWQIQFVFYYNIDSTYITQQKLPLIFNKPRETSHLRHVTWNKSREIERRYLLNTTWTYLSLLIIWPSCETIVTWNRSQKQIERKYPLPLEPTNHYCLSIMVGWSTWQQCKYVPPTQNQLHITYLIWIVSRQTPTMKRYRKLKRKTGTCNQINWHYILCKLY